MIVARPKRTRRVRRLVPLFCSGLCAFSPSAQASNWELLYRLSDRVSGSDNIGQFADPEGAAGSNDASAGLDINLITRSLTWGLSADIGYVNYFGKTDLENLPRKSVKSDLEKTTTDTDYFLSAYYSIAPATISEFADVGIDASDIERLNYGASSGFVHRVNERDNLDFAVGVSRTDFSETGPDDRVTPNRSVTATLIWTRRFNQRVNGSMKSSIQWYQADDPITRNEFLIYKNTVGTDAQMTRRFSVIANAGAAVIDNYRAEFPAMRRNRTLVYGFIGNFSLQYKPFNDTTFSFSLAQDVSTDDLGDLRASQSAGFSLAYQISDISSFNLSGGLAKSTGGDDATNSPREVWNISPVYSHRINKRWSSTVGYRFVQSIEEDAANSLAPATSNTVFISLSTNGALLPGDDP